MRIQIEETVTIPLPRQTSGSLSAVDEAYVERRVSEAVSTPVPLENLSWTVVENGPDGLTVHVTGDVDEDELNAALAYERGVADWKEE